MNHLFERDFTDDILKEICGKFGLPPENASLIKEDSNLIYDCGESILRISHSAIRGREVILTELEWMQYLLSKEVSVVGIIPSQGGHLLESVEGASCYFTAVLFVKVIGSKISKPTWKEPLFIELGCLAGRIHRVSKHYPREKRQKFQHWDELIEFGYFSFLPEDDREFKQLYQRLVAEFNGYPRSEENYGLIHNDIHYGNYLLTGAGNKVVLFDFEVACRSWYMYEISTVLYYASQVKGQRNNPDFEQLFLASFSEGYRRERSLGPIDFEVILKFMLYRDLFLIGYVNSIWRQGVMTEPRLNLIDSMEASVAVRRQRLGW